MELWIGNGINLFGVALLLISHTVISVSKSNKAFLFGIFGGIFIGIGSFILKSYPVVVLNIFWSLISILGYFNFKLKTKKMLSPVKFNILIAVVSVIMIILMGIDVDSLAFTTTFIYVSTYLLFSISALEKMDYLLWCSIGFLLLFPHLIDKAQFAVSINEIYGFFIGIFGIIKITKEKNVPAKINK